MSEKYSVKFDENPQLYCIESLAYILVSEDAQIRNGNLYLPNLEVTVRVVLIKLENNQAVVDFYISHRDWDREMRENSTGIGVDNHSALGAALAGFLFGLLKCVDSMNKGHEPNKIVNSTFIDKTHRWKLYISDAIGMGEGEDHINPSTFWEAIGDEVIARIGNQKICYVKAYVAKVNNKITTECRINDVTMQEISHLLDPIANGWSTEGFRSLKVLFVLKQEEDTYIPYPFSQLQIMEHTKLALKLFKKCAEEDNSLYAHFIEVMTKATGDMSLAEELLYFIPEICAEGLYNEVIHKDEIIIRTKGSDVLVYKSQLMSYFAIEGALFDEYDNGFFKGNQLFNFLVKISNTYKTIENLREKGVDFSSNIVKVSNTYGFSDNYMIS